MNRISALQYVDYGVNYRYVHGARGLGKGSYDCAPAKITAIKAPAATISAADSRVGTLWQNGAYNIEPYWSANSMGTLDQRHGGSINTLWVDGHVTNERSTKYIPQLPLERYGLLDPYMQDPFIWSAESRFKNEKARDHWDLD